MFNDPSDLNDPSQTLSRLETHVYDKKLASQYYNHILAWSGLSKFDMETSGVYRVYSKVGMKGRDLVVDYRKWWKNMREAESNVFFTNTVYGQVIPRN